MFIWMIYRFFDSFNGFYQFNNFEIQSSYVTGSWSNQLLDPIRLCNRFKVEPGSTIGRSGFKKHWFWIDGLDIWVIQFEKKKNKITELN